MTTEPIDIGRVERFLQSKLESLNRTEVTAVEAAQWLANAHVLRDSEGRPGLPLRNLLRAGLIKCAEQRPPQKHGRWFIVRSTADKSGNS